MCGPESFICTCLYPFARDHLLPVLKEAASMITQAPVQFEAMKRQLERAQYFIDEADRKAAAEGDNFKREETRDMVKELVEAAFQMEDVMDEYFLHEQQQLSRRDPGREAFNFEEAANVIRPVFTRFSLAQKIQSVNSRVDEIKKKYGIDDSFLTQASSEPGHGGSSSGGHQDPIVRNLQEKAPLYIEEVDVVGFEVPKAELIDWLVKGKDERSVISVVGMGGQGKTTLARKVFESNEVIARFDCHAWITVSQAYTIDGLLRDMLEQFYKEKNNSRISSMDRKSLEDEVRKYLQEKRYVVFLDDVWDTKLWDEIEFVMTDKRKGCRILVTTRNKEVALHFKKSSIVKVLDLQLLDEKQSFELFCKKAFRSDFGGFCPEELKGVSFEIVKQCDGLPLTIVVIGGVLSTKDSYERIEYMQNLSLEFENNPDLDPVTKILSSSYYDLPSRLKSCLLYFGMYPKGFAINSMRLISQWIAEGFVKQQNRKTLEKVAEGYLKELIQRSLVQVHSFTIDGKAKSCRVHDVVHEMILTKTDDLNYCRCINEGGQSALGVKSRRHSIATSTKPLLGSTESSQIRTMIFFIDEGSPEHLVKSIPVQCKLLKVLDFEKLPRSCTNFPKSFVNLLHLKYLSFRHSNLDILPEFIVKLENLETLDVRDTKIKSLPLEIGQLRKLRHLWGYLECFVGENYCISGLESLQTLCLVAMKSFQEVLINELGELRQLRYLRVVFKFEEEGSLLWHSINRMQHLEKLSLVWYSTPFCVLHRVSPSPTLQKLYLKGRLETLPDWISKLPNLVKLTFNSSNITGDLLKPLKKLPNLLSLVMFDCHKGGSLHFEDGGFQKLKELSVNCMESLNSIVIDKGALHSLTEFTLQENTQLKAVPSGIQHLEKLQVLNIYYMSREFVKSIIPNGGKHHWMIKHVPSVSIVGTWN